MHGALLCPPRKHLHPAVVAGSMATSAAAMTKHRSASLDRPLGKAWCPLLEGVLQGAMWTQGAKGANDANPHRYMLRLCAIARDLSSQLRCKRGCRLITGY